jgi:hypothetical protein
MAGGNRTKSGAPLKYGEKVEPMAIRVPKSSKKEVMSAVKEVLKKYETRYVIENQFGLYLNQHAGKDCSFTSDADTATIFRTEETATRHISRLPIAFRTKVKVTKL